MSQKKQVLDHMRRIGPITHMVADDRYGISRLAARIYDLKGKGIKIHREIIRSGTGKRFASYSLISES